MDKRKLAIVNDGYGDEPELMLQYADEFQEDAIVNSRPKPTLVEIADFLDAKAEARNNHAFVGSHRLLAKLLYLRLGNKVALKLMREIAGYSGLDGMNRVGDAGNAYPNLKLTEPWQDWNL